MLNRCIFIVFIFCYIAHPQDILYIKSKYSHPDLQFKINLVSRFYGLSVDTVNIESEKKQGKLKKTILKDKPRTIILTEDALTYGISDIIFKVNCPVLIADIEPQNNGPALKIVSNNTVTGCSKITESKIGRKLKISDQKNIVEQLANQEIPFELSNLFFLNIEKKENYFSLIDYIYQMNNKHSLFGKLTKRDIYFQIKMNVDKNEEKDYRRYNFFEIAPLMIFLKHSLKEYVWHCTSYYANLTIDDPWLIEPYGYLDYKALLQEMKKHNFHTTIAFIPWNYDRSKQEVISLFKNNPDRFSICIHGNNHDHDEFGSNNKRSLNEQEKDIRQALARMQVFKKLTGIPFDSVMIFPHQIAPEKTLGLLKKYNFLATVNASNIPIGLSKPTDPLFELRNVTLKYEGFPSLSRTEPKYMFHFMIAVDLYLGLPILFGTHHEYFSEGINSFNEIADLINKLQPNIKWENLGAIVKNYFIEKLRYDGDYDIYTFSNNIILTNHKDKDVKFHITKYETSFPEIDKVLVNNREYPYGKISNDTLSIIIKIPNNEMRNIVITYKNSNNNLVNISKNNFRVNFLRWVSDFRDFYFSKNSIGLAFTLHYYDTNLFNYGLKGVFLIVIAGLIGIFTMGLSLNIVSKSNLTNNSAAGTTGFIFSGQFYKNNKVWSLFYMIFEISFVFIYVFIIISLGISNILLSTIVALFISLIHGAITVAIFKYIRINYPIKALFFGHLVYGLIIGLIIGWIIL